MYWCDWFAWGSPVTGVCICSYRRIRFKFHIGHVLPLGIKTTSYSRSRVLAWVTPHQCTTVVPTVLCSSHFKFCTTVELLELGSQLAWVVCTYFWLETNLIVYIVSMWLHVQLKCSYCNLSARKKLQYLLALILEPKYWLQPQMVLISCVLFTVNLDPLFQVAL